MAEVRRDIFVLVSIAKVDASLNACRTELSLLPGQLEKIKRSLRGIEAAEAEARAHSEEMAKERRSLEQKLEDNAERIKKYRVQLMEVKTNKEYTAMLHEIDHIERDTESKEERLLILMDELDRQTEENEAFFEKSAAQKGELGGQQRKLESRIEELNEEVKKLEAEKPKLLAELDPSLKKRYDRILAKLHDFAVTHITDDTCQGCFARIPPQTSVEVRKNDRIITCEGCGRILVHYIA